MNNKSDHKQEHGVKQHINRSVYHAHVDYQVTIYSTLTHLPALGLRP